MRSGGGGRDPYKVMAEAIERAVRSGAQAKYRNPWRIQRLLESINKYGEHLHETNEHRGHKYKPDESLSEPKSNSLGQSMYWLAVEYISEICGGRSDGVYLAAYGTAWALNRVLGVRNSTVKTIATRKVMSQSLAERTIGDHATLSKYTADCMEYADKIWAQLMEWYKVRPWLYMEKPGH